MKPSQNGPLKPTLATGRSGIEVSFNSDDTLMGSQCNSQSLFSPPNLNSNVVDSNATIQESADNTDEMDDLQNTLNKISIKNRTNSNLALQKKSSSHSNYLSPCYLNSSSASPVGSIEIRRSKTVSSSGIFIARNNTANPSTDNHEYSYSCSCSPPALPVYRPVGAKSPHLHKSHINKNNSIPEGVAVDHKNEEDVKKEEEELKGKEDEDIDWEEKYNKDKSSIIIPRKPKSLFNESVYSCSSSINQLRLDLKMDHNKGKRKVFSNMLNKDHDAYIRERLKRKAEDLSSSKYKSGSSSNASINSYNYATNNRRISISAGHVPFSIKETDSIVKSDERNNLSLSSLNCITEGKVNQYYFIKELNSGSYGRVYLVYDDIVNKYFACKVVSKSRLRRNFRFAHMARRRHTFSGATSSLSEEIPSYDDDPLGQIKKEVAILKSLTKHPNIVLLVEVLNDAREDNIYLGKFYFYIVFFLFFNLYILDRFHRKFFILFHNIN